MSDRKTSAGLVVTAVACLMTGERHLKLSPNWQPVNERQATLLQIGAGYRAVVADGVLPIECEFSPDSDVVNAFFKRHDISIVLSPCGQDEYAMGAVMKIEVTWLTEGVEEQLQIGERTYTAAKIEQNEVEGTQNMAFFTSEGHDHKIVRLQTKEGYTVILTKAPHIANMSGPELFAAGLKLANDMQPYQPDWRTNNPRYGGVVFPESEFKNVDVDMSFLKDMNTTQLTTGRSCKISEAKGQFRGRIDRKGAVVVEAVGMKMMLESCMPDPDPLVIDDAFLAIFEKKGVGPVSVLFVAEDSWTVADSAVVTPTESETSRDEVEAGPYGGQTEAFFPE